MQIIWSQIFVDCSPEPFPLQYVTDSCLTIEGWHLWPLFEELQTKCCDAVKESEHPAQVVHGVQHIERITVRLWL